MIFIIVRQFIKRILKEETEQDLSPAIKELLDRSVVPNYKDTICQIIVIPPWKRISFIDSNSEEYEIMVRIVGGYGSKNWPQTQFVYRQRDKIVEDIWQTVYNYLGVSSSILIRNVFSCEEFMSESTIPTTIKRRANQQTLEKYIWDGEINYPTLCDDFEDAYEYADAVIDYAIGEFLEEVEENIYDEDYYSGVMDYLRKLCRDEFGKYLIDIYEMTCIENEKQEENEGIGAYAAPAFEMKPDHVHFKHQYNESNVTESSNERLEKLIGNYITMSYPTAQKIRLAPPGVNGSITTFTLPDPEDERDNLIFKFDVFGKPEYNINPEFLNSIKSMFGEKKNIRKLILKWFEEKEVDEDLVQGSKKQEQKERETINRKNLDFFDLVSKGIVFVTEPFGDGKKQKSNWDGDSNIITLWNLKHPEQGQEWVFDAVKYPKPEAIQWWNDEGQFTLKDEKYHQILRSIELYDSSNKQEQNESEITERCWKGYTQKGMKTMFGKKYPNCVKIKKKGINESKMLDYLKQFLSGEVLDNYRKEKGRKEFQKMVDMVYKITAKDNPIEGMVGVLVGHIDKSMWGVSFNDPNSVGARWDFKVILKPVFTNYNLNNERDYNERVLKFEDEFNRNARGMGFEIISPIQHKKVKNYKVTFEWASYLNVKET